MYVCRYDSGCKFWVSFVLVLSVVLSMCLDEFKMCLLWLSMICLVLFMLL